MNAWLDESMDRDRMVMVAFPGKAKGTSHFALGTVLLQQTISSPARRTALR